ncbi:MAG TPA: TA system VapC family ribonuclease toxin [Thermoanaerobaculia bacterium]|nr:TA system VapC family ribonuclease toxin [Thermoanaerobaculia bacterium]
MIALDTNILVYAHRADSPWHEAASPCVRALAEGRAAWAIPWPCLYEFVAIVTHPRIYDPPTPVPQALEQVDAWLESPWLALLAEDLDHWTALRPQLLAARVSGPQVHDARVASLCLSHGVSELWTADRDFSRFPDLAVRNPLVSR